MAWREISSTPPDRVVKIVELNESLEMWLDYADFITNVTQKLHQLFLVLLLFVFGTAVPATLFEAEVLNSERAESIEDAGVDDDKSLVALSSGIHRAGVIAESVSVRIATSWKERPLFTLSVYSGRFLI